MAKGDVFSREGVRRFGDDGVAFESYDALDGESFGVRGGPINNHHPPLQPPPRTPHIHPHPIAQHTAVVIRVQERRHGRPGHAHDADDVIGDEGPGGEPGREEEEDAEGGVGTLGGRAGRRAWGVGFWEQGSGGFGRGPAGRARGEGEVPGGVAEAEDWVKAKEDRHGCETSSIDRNEQEDIRYMSRDDLT